MGRGRAKAKQQKVARRLKYSGAGTDLDRLAEELGVAEDARDEGNQGAWDDTEDTQAEQYSRYLDDDDAEGRDGSRYR